MRSVFARIALNIVFVAVLLVGLVGYLNARTSERMLTEQISARAQVMSEFLSRDLGAAIRFRDVDALSAAAESAVGDAQTIAGVLIADQEGTVLASSGVISGFNSKVLQEQGEAIQDPKTKSEMVRISRATKKDGSSAGFVVVIGTSDNVIGAAREQATRVFLMSLLFLAVLVAGSLLLLRKSVARPIQSMRAAMRAITDGNFETPYVAEKSKDELGQMSADLSLMYSELAESAKTKLQNEFQSKAFSHASSAMLMLGSDGRVATANGKLRELLHIHAESFAVHWPSLDCEGLVDKELADLELVMPEVAGGLLKESRENLVSEVVLGRLHLEIRATNLIAEHGEMLGALMEWRDVTDEKLERGALAALGRSQTVIAYDADGAVIFANRLARTTLGVNAEDIQDKRYSDLFGHDSNFASAWERAQNGQAADFRTQRTDANGSGISLDGILTGISGANGTVRYVVEVARDIGEEEKAAAERKAEREEVQRQQSLVTKELETALAALAEGDLSHRIRVEFPQAYKKLRDDFNASAAHLEKNIGEITAAGRNIKSGALEVSQASDDLSKRTETQAATLEQSVAALDELTQSVASSAEGAKEADQSVQDARKVARDGGQIVIDTVEAMNGIERSSQEIAKIIGVIDDIAFQTNLLALNAGVEAARAGDAGRGFAVVASEVRALAQRCSDAAKQIKDLIADSSAQVSHGVSLVDRAGASLKLIVDSVDGISTLVSDISKSSQEQATGLKEINVGMTHLDTVTQQNAAMVEESSAAGMVLLGEAERLAELTQFFVMSANYGEDGIAQARASKVDTENGRHMSGKVGAEANEARPAAAVSSGWEDF